MQPLAEKMNHWKLSDKAEELMYGKNPHENGLLKNRIHDRMR